MRIERRFTTTQSGAYGDIPFAATTSEIRNPDGQTVFHNDAVEIPEGWSQVASDVIAQKYFRRAGVPARLKRVKEEGVPDFLWRSVADDEALAKLPKNQRFLGETSARQVFDRLAGTWAYWGWKGGYFSSQEDARSYHDEMRHMLARQMGAPNSPQWFNTGLHWAYGIDGPSQGHFYVDYRTGMGLLGTVLALGTALGPALLSGELAAVRDGRGVSVNRLRFSLTDLDPVRTRMPSQDTFSG